MIIPALDLIDGKIIRLQQGDYRSSYEYGDNILAHLQTYEKQGAKMLHLVDLDAAKEPDKRQTKLIKYLVNSTNIPIQIGGGIRNYNDIITILDTGVKRVVIGSMAIKNSRLVKEWLKMFHPDTIVLAIDIRISGNNEKIVAINGWQEITYFTLEQIIQEFLDFGLKYVLCTDISRDGMLSGPNIDLYKEIVKRYSSIIFQASGGISSLQDIQELRCSGVQEVIIGRALLENKFTLAEAIKCWQNV
ncbi:1-(5-phosphoribosyl)-5-[(5-phosphoribosylamino)methylideneamino]imidazole-4-carboxamide isomerase [Candidatus Ishikawella capsulata]|uniref:1-(5-phosphoribosyl)-5-[(5-phosphoribosylamino)methylideneamino] imidazole-4-carboxamide isomerase n=1 Tax=Candidatus Ishikawaella capsulata Mpkobe TaxID=476281 RepID=C5WDB2_9ENTR|nr:1-(5-phosphoribosyl)-5-[(5-phosphoribosylamino)methylideneamino]imidazole-4-carboxamide isomerase [Candidatus Ishikawaella capsulata]BAH83318.1 N-(5'-phospho-L-ribosyl-formimino)-5-amino-1-(5'-phosphoribosyl)-4-imidazolecarboxamide isomerase [Candidatus Ishikawaella capsulata Mpkobe]